jgi:hypothetical protein
MFNQCARVKTLWASGSLRNRPSTLFLCSSAVIALSVLITSLLPSHGLALISAPTALARAIAEMTMLEPPLYIAADEERSNRYQGYEVTSYQLTKHLIAMIGSEGERDRSIVIETNGDTWVLLNVATETSKGTFRFEMVNESTADLLVNNVHVARVKIDGEVWVAETTGNQPSAGYEHALEVLLDVAKDANLNGHLEVLGPFATKAVEPCCGDDASGGTATAGLCWRPAWWWKGHVKFVNCSGSGICVIPEEGGTLDCDPDDDTWYDTDGIILPSHGPGQWYKIPDHCTVTVTCSPSGPPSIYCCCNIALILAVEYNLVSACSSHCEDMDCCANPNDNCHNHAFVDCTNCP